MTGKILTKTALKSIEIISKSESTILNLSRSQPEYKSKTLEQNFESMVEGGAECLKGK